MPRYWIVLPIRPPLLLLILLIYEQRIRDIAALQKINSAIGRKTLPEIYNLIAQQAKELTHAAYATLWILDSKDKSLKLARRMGEMLWKMHFH